MVACVQKRHKFGDADEDSDIDGSDFLFWQMENGLGVAVTPSGDFDGDGETDGTDFLYWQLNDENESNLDLWQATFGNDASTINAASTGVPEPTTGIILLLGMAALLTRRGVVVP